jgi:hypothetical protein
MRTRSLSLSLLLSLVVVTGCGIGEPSGDPTPKMPPSSSPASTPTAEPEPWEVHSRAGVKAFLQRYVEVLSETFTTGDTEAYRALATDCDGCDQVADQIEKVYKAGGHIESEPDRFTGWSVDENGLKGGAECIVVYEGSPTTWVRRPGAKPETYPGGKIEYLVNLKWTGEGWTIVGLFPLES